MIRPLHKLNFQRKLRLGFLCLGILPLILMMSLFDVTLKQSLLRSERESVQVETEKFVLRLDDLLTRGESSMAQLSNNIFVRESLQDPRKYAITQVYSSFYQSILLTSDSSEFYILDAEGQMRYRSGTSEAAGIMDPEWGLLRRARREGGTVVRDVNGYVEGSSGIALQLARPIVGGMATPDTPQSARLEDPEGPYERQVLGYVVMEIPRATLEGIEQSTLGRDRRAILVDDYYQTVYRSQQGKGAAEAKVAELQAIFGAPAAGAPAAAGDGSEDGGGDKGRIESLDHGFRYSFEGYPLHLFLWTEDPLAPAVQRQLYIAAAISLLFCVGLSALGALFMSHHFASPIRRLNDSMKEVEEGNWSARVEIEGTDELSQLGDRFNLMIEQVNEQVALRLQNERELSETKLRMLKAQLNPHFLYNTLDALKWEGKIHGIPEISETATALADLLRASLSKEEFHSLREELELLDRYLEIQKHRSSQAIRLITDLEPGTESLLVPKLILQPLIENSIRHGLLEEAEGMIWITSRLTAQGLLISVEDNGTGFSDEAIERFYQARDRSIHQHYGLHNTDAILRLHFGDEHGLRILKRSRGARVELTLPVMSGVKDGTDDPKGA